MFEREPKNGLLSTAVIKMTDDDDYPEDLLDECLTRLFLDSFQVDKCDKCGRGDELPF